MVMEHEPSKNENKQTWLELRLEQGKVINIICQNLIAAGILLPAEQERYKKVLRGYDALTTVKVMLESWLLKEAHEEAQH
ncbi:unnamed protein product [marine sediment metagenome]|uniref:Uncharacterized protein n=1 Tax=marine sediment metagenome TaxID=412755 RepID=X1SEN6_9ZZZZ